MPHCVLQRNPHSFRDMAVADVFFVDANFETSSVEFTKCPAEQFDGRFSDVVFVDELGANSVAEFNTRNLLIGSGQSDGTRQDFVLPAEHEAGKFNVLTAHVLCVPAIGGWLLHVRAGMGSVHPWTQVGNRFLNRGIHPRSIRLLRCISHRLVTAQETGIDSKFVCR